METIRLASGREAEIRPIRPGDGSALRSELGTLRYVLPPDLKDKVTDAL